MSCYRPIPAYNGGSGRVQLWPPKGKANITLPCGRCIGCRTQKAAEWAARCEHEARSWPRNTFITLTYDDKHLPPENHLVPKHLQDFLKRLRKYADRNRSIIDRDSRSNIRFFACGEYGERTARPHYHAVLFNCGFLDQQKVGKDLYHSPTLAKLWKWGGHRLGEATPAAANYIAQYSLKKQGAGNHDADGVWRPAPFLRMSLKPAIGANWLDKFADDLANGYLVRPEGRRMGVPRYYQKRLDKMRPEILERLKLNNERHRYENPSDNQYEERLQAAEIMHHRRKQLTEQRNL